MTAGYIGKVSKFYPKTMRRHWKIVVLPGEFPGW